MSTTILEIYISSSNEESLKTFLMNAKNIIKTSTNKNGFQGPQGNITEGILKIEDNLYSTSILSCVTSEYETEELFIQATDLLRKIDGLITPVSNQLFVRVNFIINVNHAEEEPIPGIVIGQEFITLASELNLLLDVSLEISPVNYGNRVNSGAFFYISSDDEIDTAALSDISGTKPSVVYRKNTMGRFTVVNYNAWGIEMTNDDSLPDKPMSELVRQIKNAGALGDYCKTHGLQSHVDITCYGVPRSPIMFGKRLRGYALIGH